MPTAQQLLDRITTAYNKKRSYYDTYFGEKSPAIIQVETFLQRIIDSGEALPADAAFQITCLMLPELLDNQQGCLDKKTTGISTGSIILALLNAYPITTAPQAITKLGHYELYVPYILWYSSLFYGEYLKAQTPAQLSSFSMFSAWEAMMLELELITPSIIHKGDLLVEEEKYCANPVIGSEAIEWLYQLNKFFKITPSAKSFASHDSLFNIKEASLELMLRDSASLTQKAFNSLEDDIDQFALTNHQSIRAVVVKQNDNNTTISFHKKVVTPEELLKAAMAAYYKDLSYTETYITEKPVAIMQMQAYLQTLTDTHKALPENAAFELNAIMQPALVNCFIKSASEKKAQMSERVVIWGLISIYIVYFAHTFIQKAPDENNRYSFYTGLIGMLLLVNFLNYQFYKDRDLFLHEFGVFRAWEAIMQKLDLAFIKGLAKINHTNPLSFISASLITNPFPDKEITTEYQAIGSENKLLAKEIVQWLAALQLNYHIAPSYLTFRPSERLNAIATASEQLFPLTGNFVLTQAVFSTLENHATLYTASALRFMRRTGVLNQASFDELFSPQQAVLSRKSITENLWDKLPPHLEIPPVWYSILACCQAENAEQALINYAQKLLAGNPLESAHAIFNHTQSTHAPSIHRTVGKAALILLTLYGDQLAKDNSEQQSYISRLLSNNKLATPKILTQIETWINALTDTDHKNRSAKLGFKKLFTPDFAYVEPISSLTTLQIMRLSWLAIHDDKKRIGSLEDAKESFRDAFYEIEREYNLDAAGKEDPTKRRVVSETCVSGACHKFPEKLWGRHLNIHLEYLVPTGATKKLLALITQAATASLLLKHFPHTLENFTSITFLIMKITQEGIQMILPDVTHSYKKTETDASIADQLFEEYAELYNNDKNHPQFLGLLEAGNSVCLEFPSQFKGTLQASAGYQQYCHKLLSMNGWFTIRFDAEERKKVIASIIRSDSHITPPIKSCL